VAEHGDPLDAHPECEPLVTLGVDAPCSSTTGCTMPAPRSSSSPSARRPGTRRHHTRGSHVERHRRLRERVVARPESAWRGPPEHRMGELVQEPAKVAEVRPSSTMSLRPGRTPRHATRRRPRTGNSGPAGARGSGDAPPASPGSARATCGSAGGRRRCRRTSCPEVARRVIRRDVEHLEVGGVALDLGTLVADEPELAEDLDDPADRLSDGVEVSAREWPSGRGHVDRLGG